MRVLRLLVYEGPEDWIKNTFDHNRIKSRYEVSVGNNITSITLGTFPDDIDILVKELPLASDDLDDCPF